jgi:hypothetical protein
MYEGAKGENKQPEFPPTLIKVESGKADNDKKKERVAKYPASTESIAKKENPYRLIEEVRQHCANHD